MQDDEPVSRSSPDSSPTIPLWADASGVGHHDEAGGGPAIAHAEQATGGQRRGISRRALLVGAGASVVGAGALGGGIGFALSHHTSADAPNLLSSDAAQIQHLLRRAGFGLSPADVAVYLNAGVQGSIDRLLNYETLPDTVTSRLNSLSFDFTKPVDLIRWFLLRMIYTSRPLEEKMTLFWHGVLTSSFRKIGGPKHSSLLLQQNNLLRAQGMGRFDDLIRAISADPAMLWWLDGRVNSGKSPNENYSRELMELFTMGIGNYTQSDVHQGALALSGWAIADGKGVFIPRRHYQGEVTLLGKTGHLGLDDVVALVCAHPATGHHLAFRMWSFFVYDNPSPSDLKPLVDAYYSSSHDIRSMVRAMLTSPSFFSAKAYRARVKSPVEFVVQAVRGLGLETDGTGLPEALAGMGQTLFDPPNVSGWDGDKVSANWLSTQSWMTRVNFVNTLVAVASGLPVGAHPTGTGAATVADSLLQRMITTQRIASADDLTQHFVAALLDNRLDDDRRAVLRQALRQPVASAASGAAFTLANGERLSAANVRSLLYLLMSLPEYQMN